MALCRLSTWPIDLEQNLSRPKSRYAAFSHNTSGLLLILHNSDFLMSFWLSSISKYILCSPYVRCIETIYPFAVENNVSIKIEHGLCEWFGSETVRINLNLRPNLPSLYRPMTYMICLFFNLDPSRNPFSIVQGATE